MREELFTVDDLFKIAGREGIVIVGNYQPNFPEIKLGSEIVLIQPNGREVITEVDGVERIQTVSGIKKIAFLIKLFTKKEDIPPGTQVFLEK